MLKKNIEKALNNQIKLEAASSMAYLAIASWAEVQQGLEGVTAFFYKQSDEERVHMLKLMKFVNERGGHAQVPALETPVAKFKTVQQIFKEFINHELHISESINEIVKLSFQENDFATHSFLQWYVTEQMEEENAARRLNDKLLLIGDDKSGLYLFDRDILADTMAGNNTEPKV